MEGEEGDLNVWHVPGDDSSGKFGSVGIELKKGPRAYKAAYLASYGDPDTGEIKKQELRFRTYGSSPWGQGYDFDEVSSSWYCENGEILRLAAFLNEHFAEPGSYRIIKAGSISGSILSILEATGIDAAELGRALAERGDVAAVVSGLASTPAGLAATEAAVIAQRRQVVAHLKQLAETPGTNETKMQASIGENFWLFGGKYTGVASRRDMTYLDQHDIPLICSDGSLHIVELKGPHIPRLVRRHRNHWIVGNEVHEAVSQAQNYLRALDEQGLNLQATFENELGVRYDMRRAKATVLIGHPDHVNAQSVTRRSIEQAIRTYNSHLTRVEVLTYADLVESAERALTFEEGIAEDRLSVSGSDSVGDSDTFDFDDFPPF
ncbi:Shedu anti-phage system protein SduA domain-containing protein [Streptomyces sp. NPDC014983]|uniref:Shedu anti-phage system protein SduA domain-containing protein n=1 Tax=Streptomyces sp. NPDC014983 TaxID=3364933 RepID=UPI0037011206